LHLEREPITGQHFFTIEKKDFVGKEENAVSRVRTVRSSKYFTISNQTAQDSSLSFEALGLLTYCLSMPENWEFHPKVIWKERKSGRDTIYKMFNELISSHHCIRVRKPNPVVKNLPGEIEYEIFDDPEDCVKRIAELEGTGNFVEHRDNLKKCFRHPGFQDPEAADPEKPHLLKETSKKRNIERKEIPPPPIASSSKEKDPPDPHAPAASVGGGGGSLSSSLVGDWTYRNGRGEAVSLDQSRIFRHFVNLSFTTEILQQAILQAQGSNELIGNPYKYLEAICFRLTQENKPKTQKLEKVREMPPKNTEPRVNFMEALKKRELKDKKEASENGR